MPEVDRALAEMWLGGKSQGDMAVDLGCVQPTISCRLRKLYGRLCHARSVRLPPIECDQIELDLGGVVGEDRARMLALWWGGHSQSEIARRFKINSSTSARYRMLQARQKIADSGRFASYVAAFNLYDKHKQKLQACTMREWNL